MTEKSVARREKFVGWPVGWVVEEKIVAYAAAHPPKFQHAGRPDQ